MKLNDFRNLMKSMGYKVRVKTYSNFKAADIINEEGVAVNRGNVFSAEILKKEKAYFEFKKKGVKVDDGFYSVVY